MPCGTTSPPNSSSSVPVPSAVVRLPSGVTVTRPTVSLRSGAGLRGQQPAPLVHLGERTLGNEAGVEPAQDPWLLRPPTPGSGMAEDPWDPGSSRASGGPGFLGTRRASDPADSRTASPGRHPTHRTQAVRPPAAAARRQAVTVGARFHVRGTGTRALQKCPGRSAICRSQPVAEEHLPLAPALPLLPW